jgi:hypothetical protein
LTTDSSSINPSPRIRVSTAYARLDEQPVTRFRIREFGRRTWPDFVRIMEKHNGVWGGCWCVTFHLKPGSKRTATPRRAYEERLVQANRSHAALVYDGADVVGWCQFGPLPSSRAERESTTSWVRLRQTGGLRASSSTATGGGNRGNRVGRRTSHDRRQGGGTVAGYPIATRGKPYSSSFLWGGTESMFVEAGFRPLGHLGTSKRIMRKAVRSR